MLAAQARLLEDRLLSLSLRVQEIRGLVLCDSEGLPLVSTLRSPGLEEALGAFATGTVAQMSRAQQDFEMGPLYLAHFAGRDRQVFITPLTTDVSLAAVVDAGASATTIALHLLALTREILELVSGAEEQEEPAS